MVKSTFGRWAGDDADRDVPAKLPVVPAGRTRWRVS